MTYEESIDWLYSTQTFGIKLGLENPTRLLREFLAFPPHTTKVVQVVGTNGKGSTCAFIDSLARATGIRSGLFTSPHLVNYRERIRVCSQEIPEENVAHHLSELRELVADWEHHPTFFELTLALAMKHFREQDCELIILEAGMGGRYDATTAVPANASVVTPIDLDHTQWLGDTLARIAAEKAAVFREGVPAFSAPQAEEAAKVIRQSANQTRAPLTFIEAPIKGYSLGLRGPHQAENAALALAAISSLGYRLNYDAVQYGLAQARHAGRFEIIIEGERTLILDIAHNPHAVQSLIQTLHEYPHSTPPTLLFGVCSSKDIALMLEKLLPLVADIHFVPINSPRSTPPAELAALLPRDRTATLHPNLADALLATTKAPLVLITGSAFLIGETKALLEKSLHRPTSQ